MSVLSNIQVNLASYSFTGLFLYCIDIHYEIIFLLFILDGEVVLNFKSR